MWSISTGFSSVVVILIITLQQFSVTESRGFDGGFRDVALLLHNTFRAKLSLLPLTLDSELNIVAHTYAEKLATEMKFVSSGPGYGEKENLWAYYGKLRPLRVSTRDAVNAWYTGSNFPAYTLVHTNKEVITSNDTSLVGIGAGTNDAGYTVVVANYI